MALKFIDPMPSVYGAEEGWREFVKRLSGIRDHDLPDWVQRPGQPWQQGERWKPSKPRMIDLSQRR